MTGLFLACGASNPRDIQVPGREAGNIFFAVDFLGMVTKSLLDSNLTDGKIPAVKGKHVLVIGGGDTEMTVWELPCAWAPNPSPSWK